MPFPSSLGIGDVFPEGSVDDDVPVLSGPTLVVGLDPSPLEKETTGGPGAGQ